MQEILFINKNQNGSISTDEMVRIFEGSEGLDQINQSVQQADERLYVSWASVEMKDRAGELIPIDDMVNQLDVLMRRNAPITDEHTNKIIGSTEAYKVMEHPETGSRGILLLNRIYNDNELDDKVWSEIQNGERKGSSVGGFNKEIKAGYDEVTGERVKILGGFKWLENASVYEPCNPLAMNEGFSVVAKSNKSDVKKPFADYDSFEQCVNQNQDKNNPNSYCASIMHKIEKRSNEDKSIQVPQNEETNINKVSDNNMYKTLTGDINMDEDVKKSISELALVVKNLAEVVSDLKKTKKEMTEEEKEDIEEEKETSKEDPKEEEPKEEEKKVKKEAAASDIEGIESAPAPEAPSPEDNNEQDVFKAISELKKNIAEIKKSVVIKSVTPKPSSKGNEVKKKDESTNLALDIAMGKTKMTMMDVHKVNAKYMDGE